ncbi:MAG: ATP-grasp domain-containing protein [Pseudolabrys sp.]
MPPSPDAIPQHGGAAPPSVAIVTDERDWHARMLLKAFAALGARAQLLSLAACRFDSTVPGGVRVPGFAAALPDAVLVRTMSGGTFQAVTLRLGLLHALQAVGVRVWNAAPAIEHCVDKSATSFLLARAGLPTPPTFACESREAAAGIVAREGGPFVLKPLFGSQGRGLRLIRGADDLPAPDAVTGVYYLQRFVERGGDGYQDFRVLVSGGRVVAAMMRHSAYWITNVKQGGKPLAAVADAAMRDLAVAAAHAVGADFAGVDIIYGEDSAPRVLEVNSMPAWSGLQRTTHADIAAVLAGDLLAALATRAERAL